MGGGTFIQPISPASPSTLSAFSESEAVEFWTTDMVKSTSPLRLALDELKTYYQQWVATAQDDFWHRKSGKPVLSVVVCRCEDGTFTAYRGRNTEVSLPAGSLCAERAAIARAASEFRRASELVVVATMDPLDRINPLWPCEVCQSWLYKLRSQSPAINVVAVSSCDCTSFALRINGEMQCPPLPTRTPAFSGVFAPWPELVVRADGVNEWPWESKECVYVDGAWTFLHAAQQNILKSARLRGDHLIVGVHADDVLREEFDGPIIENFTTRFGRILQCRYVSSVLKNAPWVVTEELITSLRIRRIVSGSVCKVQDVVGKGGDIDPYAIPRRLGILDVIQSSDDLTERSLYNSHLSKAR